MSKSKQLKALLHTSFAMVIAAMMIGGLVSTLYSAEPTSGAPAPNADSASSQTNAPDAGKAAVNPHISGAELYSMHCNRCHPERYPTERTAAQWKTIMLHMQVRANIPVAQSKLILQYLQDNSGR